jgi:anti-sigma28 factor (negative regulator of flagellin synthesis)
VTQETADQNMKNDLKSSIENEKIEELKKKAVHGQF